MIIEQPSYEDERGYFLETFHAPKYQDVLGADTIFVQDNLSYSKRNVLRGLHAQRHHPQGKLVRVTQGSVFDVAVDIDPNSKHYAQWVGVELSATNHTQLWIPPGYAHGFAVLSDEAIFEYKCTDVYHPNDEIGVIWNDEQIGIDWPISDPTISASDAQLPSLKNLNA